MSDHESTLLKWLNSIECFTFRYYDKCPVGCEHCCISAEKGTANHFNPSTILSILDWITSIKTNKLNRVVCSGAELYVGEESFRELSNTIVLKYGLHMGIMTSGYWSFSNDNLKKGIAYLHECAISTVQISIDEFHFNEHKLKKVVELIRILLKEGFKVLVLETYKLFETKKNILIEFLENKDFYYNSQELAMIGRAVSQFSNFTSDAANLPKKGCDFGKRIYLESDGHLYLCSGAGCKSINRAIGTIIDKGINTKIKLFEERFEFLNENLYISKGPSTLYQNIEKVLFPLSNNPCSACFNFFENSKWYTTTANMGLGVIGAGRCELRL